MDGVEDSSPASSTRAMSCSKALGAASRSASRSRKVW
eukprot:CAMPEP_0206500820 /NCGR_PEP_ID=MMETSP0324_2-20121206/52875_1 /ASSEMBLY_ACC=CAM_ASM_000836 /TAXON_ID=2866 /ORGANISM="Crypthecodinium cohnii, Strain Seligo" /LENGTH=36 /DNA_ID= /DNA_START= /DNA_END= /DNA_ORIENTATION=